MKWGLMKGDSEMSAPRANGHEDKSSAAAHAIFKEVNGPFSEINSAPFELPAKDPYSSCAISVTMQVIKFSA